MQTVHTNTRKIPAENALVEDEVSPVDTNFPLDTVSYNSNHVDKSTHHSMGDTLSPHHHTQKNQASILLYSPLLLDMPMSKVFSQDSVSEA
jgi:hypothetical protein